jgi:2,3-bisphosphoglycerate-dependent phosphoglycerate mutase
MAIHLVFETHATTGDNESGHATGWLPGKLSASGREQARALGRRRSDAGIVAVFSSDLRRAVETVELAFPSSDVPVLLDWRLRECDYGKLNGMFAAKMHANRHDYLELAYPDGESWRQAIGRVGRFLEDLPSRWDGKRVLIVGHVATRWGLDHFINGVSLEELAGQDFAWQEGWEYQLG